MHNMTDGIFTSSLARISGPIPLSLQKFPLSLQESESYHFRYRFHTTFVTGTNRYRFSENGTFLCMYLCYERTYPTNVRTHGCLLKTFSSSEALKFLPIIVTRNRYRKIVKEKHVVTGNRYRKSLQRRISLHEIVTGIHIVTGVFKTSLHAL